MFRVEVFNPLVTQFFYVVGAYQSDIGDMRFSGSHVQVRNLNLLSKLKGVLR